MPPAHTEKTTHVRRPPNAYICYVEHISKRKLAGEKIPGWEEAGSSFGSFGKVVSQLWRQESPQVRRDWDEVAKKKAQEHAERYPGYKYRPNLKRSRSKKGKASEGGRRRSSVVQCPPSPVSVGGEAVGPARDGAGGETPPSPPLSPYGAFPVALQQPSWPVGPAGDSVHTPHSYLPPGLFSPTWSLENAAFDMALQDASLFTALWPGVNLFQPYAYGPDVAAGYPVDAYNTLGC
nr:hypothetical protein L204_05160 [Cryptococcus depauperatus CBS 7855]